MDVSPVAQNIIDLYLLFSINKMQANPDKFQVLAVGKETYEKRPTINIQNFELTCEDSALTFICCFLFDKYDFSNETELSEIP
jgi:hypothetical protein